MFRISNILHTHNIYNICGESQERLSYGQSVSHGARNDDIKFSKENGTIRFFDLNQHNFYKFINFLSMEEINSFSQIIISNSVVDEDFLEKLTNIDKNNHIIKFEKCDFLGKLPKLSNLILIISDSKLINQNSKNIIVFPNNQTFVTTQSFLDDVNIKRDGLLEIQSFNIDNEQLRKFFAIKDLKIKSIKINVKNGQTSNILNLIQQYSDKFKVSLVEVGFNDSAAGYMSNWCNLASKQNYTIIIDKFIFINGKKFDIPKGCKISFFSPGCISICGYKKVISDDIINFIDSTLKESKGIVFQNCYLKVSKNNQKTNFLSSLYNIIKKHENKLFGIVGQSDLTEYDRNELSEVIKSTSNYLMDNQNIIFTECEQHYQKQLLPITGGNVELLSNVPINFKNIKITNIDLNTKNIALLKLIDYSKVQTIVMEDCMLSSTDIASAYLEFFHHIASLEQNMDIYIVKPPAGISAKKMGVKNQLNIRTGVRVKLTSNDLKNSNIEEAIKACAGNQSKLKYLSNLIPFLIGFPGEIISLMKGKGFFKNYQFSFSARQGLRKDIKMILDSWIIGYGDQKEKITDKLVNFVVNKSSGNEKPLLFHGPPGVGKTTFIYAIAAVLRYFDTGDLSGSLYNPKQGHNKISPWCRVIPINQASDKATFFGFAPAYKDSAPGVIFSSLISKNEEVFTLIMGFDELDKIPSKKDGEEFANGFLSVFEANSRKEFTDDYMGKDVKLPLDKVFIIATANNVSQIPEALKNRLELISIDPISPEELVCLAKQKFLGSLACASESLPNGIEIKDHFYWPESSIPTYLRKNDASQLFWTDTKEFNWLVEKIGPYQIRGLSDKMSVIANDIASYAIKGDRLLIDMNYLTDRFPELVDNQFFQPTTAGYIPGILTYESGFRLVWVSAAEHEKDHLSIHLLSTPQQIDIQGMHEFKDSVQTQITSTLISVKSDVSSLNSYGPLKMKHTLTIQVDKDYSTKDMRYLNTYATLAAISFGTNKRLDHILVVGPTNIKGDFILDEEDNTVVHRLNTVLNSKNTQFKIIYLPYNLSKKNKDEIQNIVANWCRHNNLKDVKIKFVKSLSDIMKDIFQQDEERLKGA